VTIFVPTIACLLSKHYVIYLYIISKVLSNWVSNYTAKGTVAKSQLKAGPCLDYFEGRVGDLVAEPRDIWPYGEH